MGRTQQWDRAQVLSAAMQLFRRRGYLGASTRELAEATGLHPGSLYREFSNKEDLFCAALDAYNIEVVQGRVRQHMAAAQDPVAGIRSFFVSAIDTGVERDPGCLVTNTAVESFGLPEATAGVQRGLDIIESGFHDALTRARALGQLRESVRAEVLAAQLLATYQGLLVLVRAGAPAAKLHMITDGALASIGATEGNEND
ncbi:TetR/AcrR family transcriptional regulator [Nocardia sp. NBC_01327]|uniref:TetR/AcrR family transcriptional regulator n=1 Tax=Nocardia sp. NBC_01327 TaxID=2903593 RepID=UPI002E0FA283|nr:TetR/AcrR family transcriptional regulator [Nocardia sp. NBC_01327]